MMGYLLLYIFSFIAYVLLLPGPLFAAAFPVPNVFLRDTFVIKLVTLHWHVREMYRRLLANGRYHNGPNFEFLWHFSHT
jgi:hypothetical protein